MVETVEVAALPLAPRNPLSPLQQMKAVRSFHTGCEALRDAGGQVTRCSLAPTWMLPTVVVATSPKLRVLETFSAVATHLSIGRSLSSPNTGGSSGARYSTSNRKRGCPGDGHCNRGSPSGT